MKPMDIKIGVIFGGIVLSAVMLGTVVVLLREKDAEEAASSSAAEASASALEAENAVNFQISDRDMNDVVSIAVKNSKGSYEIVRTAEADDTAGTSAVFGVKGWEHVPTNTSVAMTLANNVASLSATSIVAEDCDNMDKYGLGSDAITATMTFADGDTFSYRIGNPIADGENNYFAIEGKNTVYAVPLSKVANYSYAPLDFLSKTVLEKPADEDMPTIETVNIIREDLQKPIVLTYNEATGNHEMTSPIMAYLSSERSDAVISGMFGLLSDGVLVVDPTVDDLADYGLDEPFAMATISCDDGSQHILSMGKRFSEDGTDYYPVMLEENNVAIYKVAEGSCPWATVNPTDLASKLVLTTYVWDIEELTVEGKGQESLSFVNSGTDKDTASITCNGKACDTERFRLFYTFLLATAAESVAEDDQPVGEAEASLYFRTHDGSTEQHIDFYRQDDFTCLITINGVSSFHCRASYIDAFLKNMSLFNTDEDFILTWS